MVARLSDWETRFAAFLAAATVEARAGRRNYCALFAADAVEAVTGENPAKAFRGRYSEVRDHLEATIDGLFPERSRALARRGDLAWRDGCVGVVVGADAVFVGEDENGPGLVRFDRGEWSKAWGVGDG